MNTCISSRDGASPSASMTSLTLPVSSPRAVHIIQSSIVLLLCIHPVCTLCFISLCFFFVRARAADTTSLLELWTSPLFLVPPIAGHGKHRTRFALANFSLFGGFSFGPYDRGRFLERQREGGFKVVEAADLFDLHHTTSSRTDSFSSLKSDSV